MEWLLPAVSPLFFAALCFLLLTAFWRRDRELRAAHRAIEVQSRLAAERGRRLGLLARDVTNPGLSLIGIADRLSRMPDAVPEAAKLRREGARLLKLSDEVGDSLAAEAGARRLREEPLPLGPLVEAALAEVREPMSGARHWRLDPELDGLVVLGDRRALARVLSQVLVRAARETSPGDWIGLRAVRTAEAVSLVVEDEGNGCPPGDLSAETGEAEGTRGVASGLATARDLLRAHGGDLLVEAAPGIGARAWLTLPRARVLADDPPAARRAA